MNWKDIESVNEKLKKVDIKGKKYAMVKDKVLGLRAIEPNATINTEILHFNGEQVIIKAIVLVDGVQLGSGIAEEKKGSTTINSTSFVENCETSAIGRALSSMGIGAEDSYASGEEVATAMLNQNATTSPKSSTTAKKSPKPTNDTSSGEKKELDDYSFDEKVKGLKWLFDNMGDSQQPFLDWLMGEYGYSGIEYVQEDEIDAVGKTAKKYKADNDKRREN